jgi:hypothetical protein
MVQKIVNMDLLKVYQMRGGKKTLVTVLGWGDPIGVVGPAADGIAVAVKSRTVMNDGSIKADDLIGFGKLMPIGSMGRGTSNSTR